MTDYYMAFSQDDQTPVGLLMLNEDGQYDRGMGKWFSVSADNRHFDDVEVVNVSDDFVSLFDTLDGKDELPTYQQTQKYAVAAEEPEND